MTNAADLKILARLARWNAENPNLFYETNMISLGRDSREAGRSLVRLEKEGLVERIKGQYRGSMKTGVGPRAGRTPASWRVTEKGAEVARSL